MEAHQHPPHEAVVRIQGTDAGEEGSLGPQVWEPSCLPIPPAASLLPGPGSGGEGCRSWPCNPCCPQTPALRGKWLKSSPALSPHGCIHPEKYLEGVPLLIFTKVPMV